MVHVAISLGDHPCYMYTQQAVHHTLQPQARGHTHDVSHFTSLILVGIWCVCVVYCIPWPQILHTRSM